jgi:succinyl-diaminopimelate desuccinylase
VSALEDQLAARTLELCRIKSPTGLEGELADTVEAWAKGLKASMPVFRRGHSLVVGTFEDARPTIALVGHLDTVPEHERAGPKRLEGGRLFARGASDMKGGLAVMMQLAEALPRAALPVNLAFVFYEREEGPYRESGLGPLFEAAPGLAKVKLAVVLEPSDGAVMVGCMGTLHATVRFQGKSAHSARPWQGENAIHKAGPLLEQLRTAGKREVRFGGLSFFEVMSATVAYGGSARNVVPDAFSLNLNFRFAPGKSLAAAQSEVRALVGTQASVEFIDLAPSGRVCEDNPLYQRLLAATGRPALPKQAWTDVARFGELGVDAVNYGPGETAQAHQEDESASIASFALAYETLAAFLAAG